MALLVWLCETCRGTDPTPPWECPVCKKETCGHCFEAYAVCKKCAAGKTIAEIKKMAVDGGRDFFDEED